MMNISAQARLVLVLAIGAVLAVLVLRLFASGQEPVSVLFIGNSYTTSNNLAGTFSAMAAAGGHPVDSQVVAWGGAWLRDHVDQAGAADALNGGDWDFVVIQEQSVVPSSPEHRVNAMYPAVRQLVSAARSHGTEPVLFLTWGRRDGFSDVGHYSYESMQAAITSAYEQIADEVGARVAPVGEAWSAMNGSGVQLFADDGSHPSPAGSYLAAAVLYATLFGEDPSAAEYDGSVDTVTALRLRSAAAVRVLGDRDRWRIIDLTPATSP